MKTKNQEVKIVGLTDEVRSWNDSCGLTGRHAVMKIVLAYACDEISNAEYVEHFNTWHRIEKEYANSLILEISAVAEMETLLGRRI